MRKIFISFLGTNPYLECNYYFKDKKLNNVRFVQEAMVKLFCEDFKDEDRIIIFLTKEAEISNWNDSDKNENKGLQKTLLNIIPKKNIQAVKNFPIGKTEDKIWEMFEIIYSQIEDEDEIILDITHSFRYMPMLMLLILNYSKFMKNIKVKDVYYGALEALGIIREIKQMDIQKRDVPIFRLTPLIMLQEWNIAAEHFIRYANTDKMKEIIGYYIRNEETRNEFKLHDNFVESVAKLSSSIYTSDLKHIFKAAYLNESSEIYEKIKSNKHTPKPFKYITEKVYNKIKNFKENDIKNGFIATKWCIDHKLIQQGYTILLETIISLILNNLDIDYLNKDYRELIPYIFELLSNAKEIEENEKIKKILSHKLFHSVNSQKIIDKFIDLKNTRNYLNHGGMKPNDIKSNKIERKLNKFYLFFKECFEVDI